MLRDEAVGDNVKATETSITSIKLKSVISRVTRGPAHHTIHGFALTDAGMDMLRQRMPHVDFSDFDRDRDVTKVAESITVDSIVEFVERKLAN